MSTIIIPSQIKKFVAHQESLIFSGSNVADILNQLVASYPAIKPYLLDNSEVCHFINVYLNGQDIRFLEGLRTKIEEQDIITLVPAIAGG